MAAPDSPHPNNQILTDYGLGKLDDKLARFVAKHLQGCPECRQQVGETTSDSFLGRLRDLQQPPARSTPMGTTQEGSLSYLPPRATAPPPPTESLPPGLADHPDYQIRRELGRGGMGVVYLAHNTMMGRDEVLKVIGRHVLARPGVLERFQNEIRAVARLRHPNIVAAYSAFRLDGGLVFAMEYVEGLDLSKLVKAKGRLSVAHAAYFVHQAALGLQHAAEKGMVHRDIKPHNLMLTHEGKSRLIKVLDFGLAKATREGEVDGGLTTEGQALGTPDYIAPEQIMDASSADVRADLYSLGGTLFYLLTGRPPFQATSLYDMYQAHISRDAEALDVLRPEVPGELAALVAKLMAKDPNKRFQTPGEVAQALTPYFKPKQRPAEIEASTAQVNASRSVEDSGKIAPGDSPVPIGEPSGRSERSAAPAEAQWETMIDFRASKAVEKLPAPVTVPGRPRWIWPVACTATLLGMLLVAWSAGLLNGKTPHGSILLENLPRDSEVLFDGAKVWFTWPGDQTPLEIQADSGRHRVQVEKRGFKPFGESVIVRTDQSAQVTVRLEPMTAAPPQADVMAETVAAPAPPNVAGFWWHTGGPRRNLEYAFTSDGTIMRDNTKHGTWTRSGSTVTLFWPDPQALGRGSTDEVVIAADGKSYLGQNRFSKAPVRGVRPGSVELTETTDPAKFGVVLAAFNPGIALSTRAVGERGLALEGEYLGRRNVLRTHPVDRDEPCVLRGVVAVPAGKTTHLVVDVAHHPRGDWQLAINVDGETLHERMIGAATTGDGWSRVEVDLSRFAGQSVVVELVNRATDWRFEFGYWSNVAIVSELKVAAPPTSESPTNEPWNAPVQAPLRATLFNGKDYAEWSAWGQSGPLAKADAGQFWSVRDGALHGSGGVSHLFSPGGHYKDFRLHAEVKINDGGNSGLYFRAARSAGFPKGYEVQINSTHRDPVKTGSLYGFVNLNETIVPPNTWFTLKVEAVGDRIRIWVDQKLKVDYFDSKKTSTRGHFAIQAHDPASHVQIRKLEVEELDAVAKPSADWSAPLGASAEKVVAPPATTAPNPLFKFEPNLTVRNTTSWRIGDLTAMKAVSDGVILSAGSNGNFLFTRRDDFRRTKLKIVLFVARGTEAYLAERCQIDGNGVWIGGTSRIYEQGGKVFTGMQANNFKFKENNDQYSLAKIGDSITIEMTSVNKECVILVDGKRTSGNSGKGVQDVGAAGILVKSGAVKIQSLIITD